MTKKERAQMIVERLEQVYPEGICSLDYKKPHELMIAGRLSAQCTDARVNIVTKELFAKYKTIEDFANADVADIEEIIRPCGLYKTKARSIVTDTHCIRICGRLGLTKSKEPAKVEEDLRKILPPERSSDFCHRLVLFGREYCKARGERCSECPLLDICGSRK